MKAILIIITLLFSFNAMALDAGTVLGEGKIILTEKDKKYDISTYKVVYKNRVYHCQVTPDTAICKKLLVQPEIQNE